MKKRNDIKKRLKAGRFSLAELSRKLKMNYEVLSRKVNGRSNISEELETKISTQLERWGV